MQILTKEDLTPLTEKINLLIQEVHNLKTEKLTQKWLSVDEACNFLKVSKRTLQHYRDYGILPFSQYSGKIYFRLDDLQKHLMKNYYKRGSISPDHNY